MSEEAAVSEITDELVRERASSVLARAREKSATVSSAESCTGGLIAAYLTDISGSSESFCGGIVSYWPEVKEHVLGVEAGAIAQYGVVSEQVALQMAAGAREACGSDIAVSTTGIAGPTGAEPGKPVGTVCIGIATPKEAYATTVYESGDRESVRKSACFDALGMLYDALDKLN